MLLILNETNGLTTPGQDLTDQPANVAAICNAAWTPEVIAAYKAQVEQNAL